MDEESSRSCKTSTSLRMCCWNPSIFNTVLLISVFTASSPCLRLPRHLIYMTHSTGTCTRSLLLITSLIKGVTIKSSQIARDLNLESVLIHTLIFKVFQMSSTGILLSPQADHSTFTATSPCIKGSTQPSQTTLYAKDTIEGYVSALSQYKVACNLSFEG